MFNKESYSRIYEAVKGDIQKVEAQLFEAVPFENSFYKDLGGFLMSPSKRIRSVLTFLYLRANGFEIMPQHISLMCIVELIHNASLIHDDVIDRDEIRRSEKTLNKKFGNKMAIIGGDYLLSIVMKKLTALGNIELFAIFSSAIKNMCEGEILQNENLYKIPTLEDYIEKTYKKTGSLFEASVSSAMLISTGNRDDKCSRFGKNFGIAFQIRDDLNNIITGGKDIEQGIYNAPVIYSGDKNNPAAGIEKTMSLLNNYLYEAERDISELSDNLCNTELRKLLELIKND